MLTEKELSILSNNNWHFEYNCLKNSETGCEISGDFLVSFAKDKIKEILKDEEEFKKVNFETILAKKGLQIVCESPLEIRSLTDDSFITGECALWLKSELMTH